MASASSAGRQWACMSIIGASPWGSWATRGQSIPTLWARQAKGVMYGFGDGEPSLDSDITATLARFACGLAWEDIPERIRERGKDLLLDALACALAGWRGEDTGKV